MIYKILWELLVSLVAGSFVGLLVYYQNNYKLRMIQAKKEVDEHFFAQLRVEQKTWIERRGRFVRDYVLVVEERLMYRQFPLTQWNKHDQLIRQDVDAETLKGLAREATRLIGELKLPINTRVLTGK